MKKMVLGAYIVPAILFFVGTSALAKRVDKPKPPRQRDINSPLIRANAFNVLRTFGDYANNLGDQFVDAVLDLDADDHWIDMGSGEGVAIEQFFLVGRAEMALSFAFPAHRNKLMRLAGRPLRNRPLVTGITYHMHRYNRNLPHYGNHLRHIVGRYFEDIPDNEIGRADLISDVYGVFAYTYKLDVTLAKFLKALKPNGNIFIYMGVRMEETTVRVGNRDVPILDWLGNIRGITVTTNALRGIANTRVTRITKGRNAIRIPRLRFVNALEHKPPVRRFAQVQGFITVPADANAVRGAGVGFAGRTAIAPRGYRPPRMTPLIQRRLPLFLRLDPQP